MHRCLCVGSLSQCSPGGWTEQHSNAWPCVSGGAAAPAWGATCQPCAAVLRRASLTALTLHCSDPSTSLLVSHLVTRSDIGLYLVWFRISVYAINWKASSVLTFWLMLSVLYLHDNLDDPKASSLIYSIWFPSFIIHWLSYNEKYISCKMKGRTSAFRDLAKLTSMRICFGSIKGQ